VDRCLKKLFYRIGHCIGDNPGYFVIIPVLLTALCATGFQTVKFEADPEYLFSPVQGEAKHERRVLEQHFPTNYSQFDPSRCSKPGRFGRLLVTAADGGSLLRSDVWREISALDALVHNISIDWEEAAGLRYADMCAVALHGYCWSNEVLELGAYIGQIEARQLNLTYPIWLSPDTFKAYTFPMFLGGFELSNINTIDSVSALSLTYFLDTSEEWMERRGSAWEAAFLATVAAQNLPNIVVDRFTSLTLEVELEENTNSVIPYFALNIGIMVVFCILTCMMTDWVKSKPLLGLLGVISAILGSITAFGLVMYLGMEFIGINLAAPFLMLGIGIDDTFVMLASWRRTSSHDSVSKRMAACYVDAAVSITITSITDMLSFWIGAITPFPCVRIFCVYTGACVVFTYLWHITFFGGCMALAGYAEKQNRHAITCCIVTPKSQAGSRSWLYRVFCSGGINQQDPWNPKDNKENALMKFFRDGFATWLNRPGSKALVLTVFIVYLVAACWGVTNLKEGLQKRRLSRFDSYSVSYYDTEDKYFREYPFRISVVISGELDYSSKKVQQNIEHLLSSLENTTYIDPIYSESWLRSFVDYVDRWKDYPGSDLNIDDEQSFIKTLRELYLTGTSFVQDIDFGPPISCEGLESCADEDQIRIRGSRFILQGFNIRDANDEATVVKQLREICHKSELNVTVFHPYFIYFDQFLIVLPTTVQCVLIAAVLMMLISIIFIPNPICSLWVAFSIISIEVGVVGFMTMWDVSLDSISMINLIMCIGFSVDFSAHISYHYLDSEGPPDDKVKNSLYGLGLPILQGAISTILGVIGLMIAPSYIFVTFFKMVFLVIVLGAVHGLFLLPVLLSLFGPGSCTQQGIKQKLKSPVISYTSDGESYSNKDRNRLNAFDLAGGGGPSEGLRIPRPVTTISLSTATPTDVEMSGSSPGSGQTSHTGRHDKQKKSRRSGSSSNGRHRPPQSTHPTQQQQLHEMYHNNGYVSEEDLDDASRAASGRGRRVHPRSSAPPSLMYFASYPSGYGCSPYGAPPTTATCGGGHRSSARDRQQQSLSLPHGGPRHHNQSQRAHERHRGASRPSGVDSTQDKHCTNKSAECKKKRSRY